MKFDQLISIPGTLPLIYFLNFSKFTFTLRFFFFAKFAYFVIMASLTISVSGPISKLPVQAANATLPDLSIVGHEAEVQGISRLLGLYVEVPGPSVGGNGAHRWGQRVVRGIKSVEK